MGPTRLSYVHDGSESSTDAVTYTVVDESGNAASGRIDIVIRPANDPPAVTSHLFTILEGAGAGPTGRTIAATDPDGPSPLQFTLVTAGSPFALSSDGEFEVVDPTQLDHEASPTYALVVSTSDGKYWSAYMLRTCPAVVGSGPRFQ